MRETTLGRILFGLGFAILGAYGFAHNWPPALHGAGWTDLSVVTSRVMSLGCGLALLVPHAARMAAFVFACFRLILLLLLQVPQLIAKPLVELSWYAVSENLTLIAGAGMIFSLLSRKGVALANLGNVRAGQIAFALAMPAIGLSHFFYVGNTVSLIPAWLPFHTALAYFTGAAHIAAGAGILFGILPRLAATLEAAMMSLFTLVVWVPAITAKPDVPSNWSEFCISTALAGAAWAVASSFHGRSWGIEWPRSVWRTSQ